MNTGAWAWVIMLISIAAYVVGYDVWAQMTGHITMSGEFHDLMIHQISGPLIVGGWVGVTGALLYHFSVT